MSTKLIRYALLSMAFVATTVLLPTPDVRAAPGDRGSGANGEFVAGPAMATARTMASAVRLLDGRVLIAGGLGGDLSIPQLEALASAEIYDPETDSFTTTGSMAEARINFMMELLPDGRVLVAGGEDLNRTTIASAEVYDPGTGEFVATGSLGTDRKGAQVHRLPSGQVLMAAGVSAVNGAGNVLRSAEVYQPDSGVFAYALGDLTDGFTGGARSAMLSTGEILIAGGSSNAINSTENSTNLFDPDTTTFSAVGPHQGYRINGQMLRLADDRVLFIGGSENDPSGTAITFNEVFDPVTHLFSVYSENLTQPRTGMTASRLTNGDYLIAGGSPSGVEPPMLAAELFVAATETFEPTAGLTTARLSHTATTLLDGSVLIAGGQTALFGAVEFIADSEIYVSADGDGIFSDGFDGSTP